MNILSTPEKATLINLDYLNDKYNVTHIIIINQHIRHK
ncbi:hypothetical protein EHF_0226 [Ehrlichia japonica]|uniref:Uncharacterized protein n=1 Tax=Ehrlichia japonica TaxID=391036 RepID=X5GL52_9RICK|nr:hypothetical protein EHF_0226 [Ehrlichia japonica]